jgi:hypothetical protein
MLRLLAARCQQQHQRKNNTALLPSLAATISQTVAPAHKHSARHNFSAFNPG